MKKHVDMGVSWIWIRILGSSDSELCDLLQITHLFGPQFYYICLMEIAVIPEHLLSRQWSAKWSIHYLYIWLLYVFSNMQS